MEATGKTGVPSTRRATLDSTGKVCYISGSFCFKYLNGPTKLRGHSPNCRFVCNFSHLVVTGSEAAWPVLTHVTYLFPFPSVLLVYTAHWPFSLPQSNKSYEWRKKLQLYLLSNTLAVKVHLSSFSHMFHWICYISNLVRSLNGVWILFIDVLRKHMKQFLSPVRDLEFDTPVLYE